MAYSDWVSMSKERLNLLLVMDIPNSEDSVFATTNKIFTIWTNRTA